MQDIKMNVIELLASKICHDLISPIGAVNNGVEFMEEMGAEAGDEITNLIAFSAAQASGKLQAFRMAYGAGGTDSSIKVEDVHACLEKLLTGDNKIKIDWDPEAPLGPEDTPLAFCKMLMCTLLIAIEALPKGGELSLKNTDEGAVKILSKGENAGLKPLTVEALQGDMLAEELEPKFIQPFITNLIAAHYKYTISYQDGDGECALILKSVE